MIDGAWHDRWYDTEASQGRFIRSESQFRNWVTEDGCARPNRHGGFKAETGRYHLYVSLACPWAHRTLNIPHPERTREYDLRLNRALAHGLGRVDVRSWSLVSFQTRSNGAKRLYEIYAARFTRYSGRVTIPILWDKKTSTIVSNESSEIIRMLNSAFDGIGAKAR